MRRADAAGTLSSRRSRHDRRHQIGNVPMLLELHWHERHQDMRVNREPNPRHRSRRPTLDSNRHAEVVQAGMDFAAEMLFNYAVGVRQVLPIATSGVHPSASHGWTHPDLPVRWLSTEGVDILASSKE